VLIPQITKNSPFTIIIDEFQEAKEPIEPISMRVLQPICMQLFSSAVITYFMLFHWTYIRVLLFPSKFFCLNGTLFIEFVI
jgi:hypothetical protein